MRRIGATAGLLSAALSLAGLVRCGGGVGDPPAAEELLAETLRLVEQGRPYRTRFSGALAHAECPPPAARPPLSLRCRPSREPPLERIAAVASGLGRRAAIAPEDPLLARSRALLELLGADTSARVNRAGERLTGALRRDGRTPELLNDLAALQLVRAEVLDAPADGLAALHHLDDALALRSPFPEAETNRALALERLTLWSAAAAAWRRAEEVAEDAAWRAEARAGRLRCEALARRALPCDTAAGPPPRGATVEWVRRHPLAARRAVEAALGEWATLARDGRAAEAEGALRRVAAVAAPLSARTGDRLYLDALERIEAARREGTRAVDRLAAGHAAFAAARGDAIYSDCSDPSLPAAGRALADAGSPYAGWALLDAAICAYFEKDFRTAEAKLRAIAELSGGREYRTLNGRRWWMVGLLRMVQGRYDEALAAFRSAADEFARVGEVEHVTYLHSMIAKTYRYLGADELAWRHRLRALAGRGRLSGAERCFTVLEEVVEALQAAGDRRGALPFLAEQLTAARQEAATGDRDLVVYTLLDRREVLLALGREESADADLTAAEHAWRRLPAGHESRQRLRLELDFHHALAAGDDDALLAAIGRGLEFFQRRADVAGDRLRVLALHREEAAVHRRRGQLERAERALRLSLDEVEAQRGRLQAPELRASFLDEMRGLNDQMVAIQLDDRGDPWRALELVERTSNRVLLDLVAPGGWEVDRRRLAAALPEHTVVVRYGRLGDRLLVWGMSAGAAWFEERPLPRRLLAERLESLHRLLRESEAEDLMASLLADLGERLLPERLHRLPAGTTLVFVTEDSTAGVPFAALGAGAGYLGDRHPISTAPSLAVYLRSLEQVRGSAPVDGSVLVVTNPRFDRGLFPALPALDDERLAAARLRRLHPEATAIAGADATEAKVLAALADHRLFHFEGHALADPVSGARSALLLAPADPAHPDREGSLLRAEELARVDLSHSRLIVLGACSTAVGLYPESREVASLATGFLGAGAPAVVASLWDVEDAASAALLETFHRRLAAGDPPALALQRAQAALRSEGGSFARPESWAGFVLFGDGGTSVVAESAR